MVELIFLVTFSCSKFENTLDRVAKNHFLTEVQKKEIIFVLRDTFSTCKTKISSNEKPNSE